MSTSPASRTSRRSVSKLERHLAQMIVIHAHPGTKDDLKNEFSAKMLQLQEAIEAVDSFNWRR